MSAVPNALQALASPGGVTDRLGLGGVDFSTPAGILGLLSGTDGSPLAALLNANSMNSVFSSGFYMPGNWLGTVTDLVGMQGAGAAAEAAGEATGEAVEGVAAGVGDTIGGLGGLGGTVSAGVANAPHALLQHNAIRIPRPPSGKRGEIAMDFGALPPEINSGRMYSGPGAGSMLAAAAAWDGLAAELYATASGYGSVTSGLAGKWQGPAALAMAQDAAAMYGYAGASATAAKLTPFSSPPATTDPAGLAKQGAAVAQSTASPVGIQAQEMLLAGSQLVSALPRALAGLSASTTATQFSAALTSLSSSLSKLSSLTVPLNFAMYPLNFLDKGLGFAKAATGPVPAAAAGAMKAPEAGARSLGSISLGLNGGGSAAMSAAMGRGMSIGGLSVPQGWIATHASHVAAALPSAAWNPAGIGSADRGSAGMPLMPLASMGEASAPLLPPGSSCARAWCRARPQADNRDAQPK